MRFEPAEQIADAILYEGYVLYPYRASATRSGQRRQPSVLAPESPSDGGEPAMSQTECLVEPGTAPAVTIRVRFLQLQRRTLEDAGGREVPTLRVGSRSWVAWDEAVAQTVQVGPLPLAGSVRDVIPIRASGGRTVEAVHDADGVLRGRVVRTRWPLDAELTAEAEPDDNYLRLRLRLRNLMPWEAANDDRDLMLRRSLISAHLLLGIEDGAFVSLLEPPPEAEAAAAACRNRQAWPVLAGPSGSRDVVLSSPVLLYDHPSVAPEGTGDLCDGAEIDEILSLRSLTLTEEAKRRYFHFQPDEIEPLDEHDGRGADVLAGVPTLVRTGAAARK